MQADVTRSRRHSNDLIDTAWQRFGSADILVNNAGVEHKADFWDTTEADYDEVMTVNLRGPFFLTQEFVRRLRERKTAGPHREHQLGARGHGVSRLRHLLLQQGRHCAC